MISLVSPFMLVGSENPPTRELLDMNTHWAFHEGDAKQAASMTYDDRDWEAVSIPHVMRIERKHNGGEVYQGIGWYRRYFRLSDHYRKKRITLHFEGVQTNCQVFLNGKKIAEHAGGYLGFVVDITNLVRFDADNLLAVRVSNADDERTPPGKPMRKLDFNYFGGIYRDVKLLITDKTYISDPLEANIVAGGGILVSYPEVSKARATIDCRTHIINSHTDSPAALRLETLLLDSAGHVVSQTRSSADLLSDGDSTFQQRLHLQNPKLWHPDHPFRYRLVSRVYDHERLVDEVITWIGIRRFDFLSRSGKADGFYVNGEKLYIRGANRHQAFPFIGDAASSSMQYRDALLLKKGGFNAVRAAHYPPSPAFLDACDALGILVVECQPGWQFFGEDPVFVERSYRDIRDMIRRDRNHPSIFLWETSLNESPTPSSWMRKAVEIAHNELPGDQLFTADDLNDRSKPYYDVFYKVINPDGSDPLPGSPSLTREWGDAWFADPTKENGLRASRIYGEKGLINQCILRQQALNGEKEESRGGYWDHAGLDANPRISGYFLWSFNDYTRGYDPVTAFSGVVDLDRYPKFGYYQMKAMQDARNASYGPMVHIASYNARKDLDATILVFSNCDTVLLFRNGRLVGEKDRASNSVTVPFVFDKGGSPYFSFALGSYQQGELRAEGILDGKVVCTHRVATPGQPHHLEIDIADQGIAPIADGSDMVPVYVKVCDEMGNLVSGGPQANGVPIELTLSGKGELIGGNSVWAGINPQLTEGGIVYALIRTVPEAGKVTIQAHSEGLLPAKAEMETLPRTTRPVPDGKHPAWTSMYRTQHRKATDTIASSTALATIDLSQASVQINGSATASAEAIHDGKLSTSWQAMQATLPFTMLIDLGKSYDLEAYRIYWGKDSDWYTYSLELSPDGHKWFPIENHRSGSGQDYGIKALTQSDIRYARLVIEGIRPENSTVKMREIEFFERKVN